VRTTEKGSLSSTSINRTHEVTWKREAGRIVQQAQRGNFSSGNGETKETWSPDPDLCRGGERADYNDWTGDFPGSVLFKDYESRKR